MDEETYKQTLADNPLLIRRPDLITDPSQNTRDFKFDEEGESSDLLKPHIKTESGDFVGFPRSPE